MNITVFGKTGTGKSIFASQLIKKIRADIPIYMITDNTLDFKEQSGVVLDIDYTNYRKVNFDKVLDQSRVRIVFGMISDKEINEFMDKLSYKIYNRGVPCLLVIDEAHMIYSKRLHSRVLERLVRGGRKKHIHLMMITQQIIDLDLSILKQSKYTIVFRLSEANDVAKTSENLQISPDRLVKLPRYHYLIYDSYSGKLFESYEILK